jgi:hypothetical protein
MKRKPTLLRRNQNDSYVVRVYRCDPTRPRRLVGVVETPEEKDKLAFTSADELWEILTAGSPTERRHTRQSRG